MERRKMTQMLRRCHIWIGKFNIIITIFLNLTDLNEVVLWGFFCLKLDKLILKSCGQRNNYQENFEKRVVLTIQNALSEKVLHILKVYSAIMNIMRYWHMSGSTIQMNRLENPETAKYTEQLNKSLISKQWRKKRLFSKVLGKLSSHLEKKLDLYFTDYTKMLSRWIKDVALKKWNHKLPGDKRENPFI